MDKLLTSSDVRMNGPSYEVSDQHRVLAVGASHQSEQHNQLSIIAPSPRDIDSEKSITVSPFAPISYQKLPQSHTSYLAYVVAIRDPLNFHLDIYWPEEIAERYFTALKYDYTFVSEELGSEINVRPAYSCHLRGVEIVSNGANDAQPNLALHTANMKEAYIIMSKRILRSGGWVLISVSDIDVYRRVLVNIFDVVTRQSLNQELLSKISARTGECIAKEYVRPTRPRNMFHPSGNLVPKDYHIVYGSTNN